jgi:hypothetical protein
MKYLKRFENLNSLTPEQVEFHLEEIKDLFQDYIDEYNIEELPDDMEEDDDSKPGIYYHISDFSEIAEKHRRPNGVLRRSQFELTLYCTSPWYGESWRDEDKKKKNIIWERYFKLISEDIEKYIERLKDSGYIIKYRMPEELVEELVEDSEFNIFISLERFTS